MTVARMLALWSMLLVLAAPTGAVAEEKPMLVLSSAEAAGSDAHLEAFARALGTRQALQGPALAKRVEARLSRQSGALPGGDQVLVGQVERGRKAFINGEFQEAVKLLETARRSLMTAEGRLASNQSLRASLHTALLMLGHTYLRLKKPQQATEAVSEVIRSFPDRDLSLVKYAPELVRFYKKVRLQVRRQARATLRVVTDSPGCMVFVNGRYVGLSPATVKDLYPGRYSVYVQRPQQPGRVHAVVMDGSEQRMYINFGLDAALHTAGHVTLRFTDEQQLKKRAMTYAVSLARKVGASQLILAGVRQQADGRVLQGKLVYTDGARVVRTGSIPLEPASPSPVDVQSLVDFLLSGKKAPIVTEGEGASRTRAGGTPPPMTPASKDDGGSSRWMGVTRWVALGVALAGLGAGIPLMVLDGGGTCDTSGRCPDVYQTMAPGAALTAVGGAAAVGAVVLFILDARAKKKTRRVSFTPVPLSGGAGVGATFRF